MSTIYIPLCFYFISFSATDSISGSAFTFHYASTLSNMPHCLLSKLHHLHSIMLLLYRIKGVLYKHKEQIYIPLCFYFIKYNVVLYLSAENIYIPLCFYFIDERHGYHSRWIHIYIPLCFYFIRETAELRQRETNLHSIMLLLYPGNIAVNWPGS